VPAAEKASREAEKEEEADAEADTAVAMGLRAHRSVSHRINSEEQTDDAGLSMSRRGEGSLAGRQVRSIA
jgi:hypothetical protein